MYEIWMTTTTGGVPMSRQSKLETASIDDGSKNKRATLNLFGRFIGKKAPSNSLKTWTDEQSQLNKDIMSLGFDCDKPGIRRITRDRADDIVSAVNQRLDSINQLRDAFIQDVPQLKQQILDSYVGDQCYHEVQEALDRWYPNPDRMTPTFGITDLAIGTGLVPSEEVTNAIAKSELNTRMAMVQSLEEELKELFERCDSPERVRGQLRDAEGLLEKLQPLVAEFSSSPDLVENLNKGLEALKAVPLSKDGLLSEQGQEAVAKGLEVFTNPSEPEISTTQAGEWTEEDEQAQADHLQALDESYDANPSHDTETGDVVVDTNRPITEIMAEKYGDDDDDVF